VQPARKPDEAAVDRTRLTLVEAAAAIREGVFTAEAYARALLERCERATHLNAFVALDRERVIADARAADHRQRAGKATGPLHGIPLAIKDSVDIAGLPTTAGTPALADHVVGRTATLVQRLFGAGALLLGKTCMHELAFGITSSNAFSGATRNPYHPGKSAGGSSGGSAVAVAARMAPAGIGSDTAGSVRIPAAHCGVFGFRPTTGRYPCDGFVPLFHTRDTPGFMARSAGDIALLDAVASDEHERPAIGLRGLRIGLPGAAYFDGVEQRVSEVIESELRRLSRLGVAFIDAPPPEFGPALGEVTDIIRAWELPRDIAGYLRETGARVSFEEVLAAIADPHVRDDVAFALTDSDRHGLEQAYREVVYGVLPRHRAAYSAYFRKHDLAAIAFPTTPLAPTPIDANVEVLLDDHPVSIWRTLRNTVPATLRAAPGISLPAGVTGDGLPVGLELDGAPGADRDLLAIAIAWEGAHPGLPEPPAP